jgi:hypothetical protein
LKFAGENWKYLTAFVRVVPNGDILPLRGKFNPVSNDWQVAVNHVYADENNDLWYSLPDVAVSLSLALAATITVFGFALVPLVAQTTNSAAGGKNPNVVLILADNLGYGDMGPQNSNYQRV